MQAWGCHALPVLKTGRNAPKPPVLTVVGNERSFAPGPNFLVPGEWFDFEIAVALALHLSQVKRQRSVDRLALVADHLLYGPVLSATRPTSRR